MEITWFGHACFELKNSATILTDPYDDTLGLNLPPLQANIVTVSHNTPHHNAAHRIGGAFKVLNRPGEYEIQQIFITGHALHPPATKTETLPRNIAFVYEIGGITVCHMGDLGHVPIQSQIETFDNVDILLIPVGGGKGLNAAKASEVIGIIEPSIVIPMHYALPGLTIPLEPLDRFLKEMGISQIEPQPRLKIAPSNLPAETQTIVLIPQIS